MKDASRIANVGFALIAMIGLISLAGVAVTCDSRRQTLINRETGKAIQRQNIDAAREREQIIQGLDHIVKRIDEKTGKE